MDPVEVGVLALQGDFALHATLLAGLGARVHRVRRIADLAACDALVLPGGESTTLRKLMARSGLDTAIVDFAGAGGPVLGTCAGCILLARALEDSGGVEPLGLLDIVVRRNGYGRQIDSFEAEVESADRRLADAPSLVSFIRAPRILTLGPEVEAWGRAGGEVVAVRQGRIAALTFHPEVTGDPRWHRAWLESAREAAR